MANEKRLIWLEDLVENFRKTKLNEVFPNWKDLPPNVTSAIIRLTTRYRAIVLSAPAVDAVEVVRCKDCKHYWKNVNTPGFDGKCTTVGDDDFCSDGERKDNE